MYLVLINMCVASEPANYPKTTIDYCLINEPLVSDADLERLASRFFGDEKHSKIMEYPNLEKDD